MADIHPPYRPRTRRYLAGQAPAGRSADRPRLTLHRDHPDELSNSTARTLSDAARNTAPLATGASPEAAEPRQPLIDPADPRWVLAVRTSEQLEGAVLGPERREKLLRLGGVLGLRPFDCNLVIAIVQDQARRGVAPRLCPGAGRDSLAMVPIPPSITAGRRALNTACWVAGALALELVVVASWLASLPG